MERFIIPIFGFFGMVAGMFLDSGGGSTESVTQYGKTTIEAD